MQGPSYSLHRLDSFCGCVRRAGGIASGRGEQECRDDRLLMHKPEWAQPDCFGAKTIHVMMPSHLDRAAILEPGRWCNLASSNNLAIRPMMGDHIYIRKADGSLLAFCIVRTASARAGVTLDVIFWKDLEPVYSGPIETMGNLIFEVGSRPGTVEIVTKDGKKRYGTDGAFRTLEMAKSYAVGSLQSELI
jgi:hypothetical protein